MIQCARAAVVLAILAYWPNLLEQFETPKAAVVAVLGGGLLAAVLATLVARRVRAGAASGFGGPPPEAQGRSGKAGRQKAAPAAAGQSADRWQPLDLAMAAWLLVEVASTATSVAPAISVFGDTDQCEGLLTSLGLAGLYAAGRLATASAASARRTLQVSLAAIAAACAVALWQLASFEPTEWQNAPAYLGWYRPFGTLGHANLLGVAAAGAFSATLGLAVSRKSGRIGWAAGGLLFGVVTVLTLSRAAWLAAVAGSLVTLAAGRPWSGRPVASAVTRQPAARTVALALAGVAVIVLALFVLVPPLRTRVPELLSLGSGSGRARLEIWKSALAMWRAHPWLGSGPDTFHLLFDRHQTAGYWLVEWGAAPFHAHSIYLHTLATRGIAGVLAAAVVLGAVMHALRAGARGSPGGRELVPPLAGLLAALGVAGSSGALGIAGAALVACTLGVLPGLARAPAPARAKPVSGHGRSRAPLLTAGLAGLLVLLPTAAWLRASHAAFLSQPDGTSQAIALAERAVDLVPWSDVMAANAAEVLRRRASQTPDPAATLALAERHARRAIELAPQRLYNQSELALLLLPRGAGGAPGREREAAAAIARCMELGPHNIMPLVHYAELASRLGRPDLALPIARRAAEIYPGEALPQAVLGEVYRAGGDVAAARAAMERSLTLEWREDRARRERVERALAGLDSGRPGGFVLGGR